LYPPIVPGADVKTWQFNTNLDKARQLLKQAGYPDGVDVTLEYAAIFWFEEQLAIQMKDQLGKVGIRVNLQKITDANMRSRTAPNKRDLPFFTFMDNPIVLDTGVRAVPQRALRGRIQPQQLRQPGVRQAG